MRISDRIGRLNGAVVYWLMEGWENDLVLDIVAKHVG